MSIRLITVEFPGYCAGGHPVPAGTRVKYDRDLKPRIRGCPVCDPELGAAPGTASSSTGPQPAKIARLRVQIQRVKFTSADGTFVTASALVDPEQPVAGLPVGADRGVAVVGNLGVIRVGDTIEAYGHFENDPRFGWQFAAARAVQVVGGTLEGLRAFLTRLPHVGRRRAQDIIQACGNDRRAVLDAIENHPERLTEVNGITLERAQEIQATYRREDAGLREVAEWLAEAAFTENLAAKILDRWGGDARVYLEEDPYRLMEIYSVGFAKADEVALEKFHVDRKDPRRAAAAVLYLLTEEERGFGGGHTWTDIHDLTGFAPPAPGIAGNIEDL